MYNDVRMKNREKRDRKFTLQCNAVFRIFSRISAHDYPRQISALAYPRSERALMFQFLFVSSNLTIRLEFLSPCAIIYCKFGLNEFYLSIHAILPIIHFCIQVFRTSDPLLQAAYLRLQHCPSVQLTLDSLSYTCACVLDFHNVVC